MQSLDPKLPQFGSLDRGPQLLQLWLQEHLHHGLQLLQLWLHVPLHLGPRLLQLGHQEHLQQPDELLSSSPDGGDKLDFSSVLASVADVAAVLLDAAGHRGQQSILLLEHEG